MPSSVLLPPVDADAAPSRAVEPRRAVPPPAPTFDARAADRAAHRAAHRAAQLTIIVPAYNEGESLADTIRSVQAQSVRVAQLLVVDDCSTDDTAAVARALGVAVLTPPANTGSKAGAQNFALGHVRTTYTMAIDADTTLAPDAVERLLGAFDDEADDEDGDDVADDVTDDVTEDDASIDPTRRARTRPTVAAACGFVVPRHVRTIWERGRYVEYLFAFTFYKRVQDYHGKPFIASGCFSAYRTDVLRAHGGWGTRTLAEDMDLTWSFYRSGLAVRFVPEAVCYPIEPHSFDFLRKQLKRWSHGFVQNVSLHWRGLLDVPYLRSAVAVSVWDATLAAALYLVALPVLAIALGDPRWLLGYVLDVPALLVPVLAGAIPRGEAGRALASIPAFLVVRTVNAVFFLMAVWQEWVLGRSFRTYEKGH